MKYNKRKRCIAFTLSLVMLFTTACSSGFYADEILNQEETVSGNSIEQSDTEKEQSEPVDAEENQEQNIAIENEDTSLGNLDTESKYGYIDGQYHYDPEDLESIDYWVNLYIPDDEDLLDLSDEWWENLYYDEYLYANMVKNDIENHKQINEKQYYGQDIATCINIIESGTAIEDFFIGSVFTACTLEDLYKLKEFGYTTLEENVIEFLLSYSNFLFNENFENISTEFTDCVEKMYNDEELDEKYTFLMDLAERICGNESSTYALVGGDGDEIAKPHLEQSGFGGSKHETIWFITLGGVPALCMDCGLHCNKSLEYQFSYQYKDVIGNFLKNLPTVSSSSDLDTKMTYVACQVALWIELAGGDNLSYKTVQSRAKTYVNQSTINLTSKQWDTFFIKVADTYMRATDSSGSGRGTQFYVWTTYSDSNQDLMCKRTPKTTVLGKFSTVATVNGEKEVSKKTNTSITISDKVTYSGYSEISGKTGTMKGWVVQKSTGAKISGTEKSQTFTVNSSGKGTVTMSFEVDITNIPAGDTLVVYEEFYCQGNLLISHKSINDSDQSITIIDEDEPVPPPHIDPPDPTEDILYGSYSDETEVSTTVTVNKKDIETYKNLQGVYFRFDGDFGKDLVTDENGNCSLTKTEDFSSYKVWTVTTGDHEVEVSSGDSSTIPPMPAVKETKYYYKCESCGQSQDYDSSSSRDTAGEEHCVNHAKELAVAEVNAQVAAYSFHWSVTETYPRTTTHTG